MSTPRHPEPRSILLGKYRVESLIGEGGMGAVYKAHHLELEEAVAIKCLLPEMMSREDIVRRFLREAKAAVKLKGEHVARVLDVGRLESDIPYIVMEYLDGSDLSAIIKHYGAQDPTVSADLILQACEALAEAHSLGIIHRDVKASNFFITRPENQAPFLKVLDFGIATSPKGASDLTSTQSVIGTPAYMAPEQMRESRTVDPRSDIWSLGVVLYEMLEGERPFRAEAYPELCLKVGMDPPEPMVQPGVPAALRDIVLRCLEKPVENRYQSVAELAFDLLPFASDPIRARAGAELCARLLGRQTRSFEAVRASDAAVIASPEPTPLPAASPRLAPPGEPRTPTNGGELTRIPDLRGRRRLAIGIAAAATLLLAGGIYFGVVRTGAQDGPAAAGEATQPVEPAAAPVLAPPAPPAEETEPAAETKPAPETKAAATDPAAETRPAATAVDPAAKAGSGEKKPKPAKPTAGKTAKTTTTPTPTPPPPVPPKKAPKTEPGGDLFIRRQ